MEPSEEQTPPATAELVIARTFRAPREAVYKAFTEEDRLAHWWGPKGFRLQVHQLDFQPGGIFHYSVEANGMEMWGRFVYREIEAPERIVFTNSFSDATGGIVRAPFSPTWPLEILNTWTFTERDGQTTVTLQGGPVHATAEESGTFASMLASMKQGFEGTFDQLDAYLAASGATTPPDPS